MAEAILADVEASGIYQIRNLVNGKVYIGSAKCFRVRWNSHRAKLVKGGHHSKHLQASWVKHGPNAFAFEPVEVCSAVELVGREQFWIDSQRPVFNVCLTAGSTLGRKFSTESKEKIAAKARGRKCPARSAEYRAKVSARLKGVQKAPEHMAALQAARGRQIFTEERRARVSEALRLAYARGDRSRDRPQEYRDKIASSLRGRPLAEETKRKISLAQAGIKKGPRGPISAEALVRVRAANAEAAKKRIGIKRSPESVAKMAASLRGKTFSAERKAEMAIERKSRWQNPEFREKMSLIHKERWKLKKLASEI